MAKQLPTALRVTYAGRVMTVCAGTVGNPGNRRFKNESAFWYELKMTLMHGPVGAIGRRCGDPRTLHPYGAFDLVKKVMSKDGHLVGGDGYPYYLRDRKHRFCIHDPHYALRDITEELRDLGRVVLAIERWSE